MTVQRRLGTRDAVIVGLSAMVGAGVFSVWAPAAAAAGSGLLIGLFVAGLVAYCNASSSAALAMRYPESGGTYVYGRRQLGHWWGFTAGWGFVVGKTASCGAMALTFAHYVNSAYARPLAVGAVVLCTVVTCVGITKTARVATVLLTVTVLALVVVLGALYGADVGVWGRESAGSLAVVLPGNGSEFSLFGVLQAAGLLFFAFAGYARIATMGGEVRDPQRTLGRAIPLALGMTLVLYALVAVAVLLVFSPAELAATTAPLVAGLGRSGLGFLVPVAMIGAAVASVGALLALLTGVSRTVLAMASARDLPGALSAVDSRYHVPQRAQLLIGALVCVLVATVDLRSAIGFSSLGVLVYYAIANASAFRLSRASQGLPGARRGGQVIAAAGLVGCAVLVVSLPWSSILAGLAVFAVGLGGRALMRLRPGG